MRAQKITIAILTILLSSRMFAEKSSPTITATGIPKVVLANLRTPTLFAKYFLLSV
jgi:hypothetical protein